MPSNSPRLTEREITQAMQDQRIAQLIEAGKLPRPDHELLANIYRRRGDLTAAAREYERLHANGSTAPGVALFHAIFNRQNVPERMPQADFAPAPFIQFDDFFTPQENQGLLHYAIDRQGIFHPTELQKADLYEKQRNNLVTYEVGAFGDSMRSLVTQNLPLICDRLNMPAIDIKFIQLKIAAYGQGDFFKPHQDNGLDHVDRLISFVYYFHQEPKAYQGGDLLLYDSRFAPRAFVRSLFSRIVPRNNSVIFFPSEYFHEVTAVAMDDQDFRLRRFTMAGHVG